MRNGRLGVVVVNFGSSALLESNLAPLTSRLEEPVVVVVVDNYSGPQERDRVGQLARQHAWHTVLPDDNRGFGAGANLGVAAALAHGADVLLLLNPDARIDPASVGLLRGVVDDAPLTMAAPRILRPDGSVWFDGISLDLDTGRMRSRRTPGPALTRRRDWLTGACLMLSRQLWERVGGFDERYFLYWEDVDLSWRVLEAGGHLLVVDAATAVHDEGGTQSRHTAVARARAKSVHYYYYNVRNRLLFASLHLPPRDRRRWAVLAVPVAYETLLQGGRRQLISPVPPLRAVGAGLRDGWRVARGRPPRRGR